MMAQVVTEMAAAVILAVVVTAVRAARVYYSEGLQAGGYSWVLALLCGPKAAAVLRDAVWEMDGAATWLLVHTN